MDARDHLRQQLAHRELPHLARRLNHVGWQWQRVGHHHLLEHARLDPLRGLPVEEAVRREGKDAPRAERGQLVGSGAERA